MDKLQIATKTRENVHQIFLTHIANKEEVAKLMSGLANSAGGSIWLGVKKNGKVLGVYPQNELLFIREATDLVCSPKIEYSSCEYKDHHKIVLEIQVKEAPFKPVLVTEVAGEKKAYIRSGSTTLLANKILLGVWKNRTKIHQCPEQLSEEEKLLLEIIKQAPEISLAQLYRKSTLKKNSIDKLLIQLILYGKVKINTTSEWITFSIVNSRKGIH